MPLHVNEDGEVTIVPPPATSTSTSLRSGRGAVTNVQKSGMETLLETLFGF